MLGDKLRFRFSKTGTLRLLSHHDLMRCLERMLRRADLPVKFSAGFHPAPRIIFALSLPLGVAGLNEVVELEFTQPCDSDNVLARMNREAPAGLAFHKADIVPMKATATPRRVEYRLAVPPDRSAGIAERCRELIDSPKIWVERVRPAPKQLNIRPYLRNVAIADGTLLLNFWVTNTGTARAEEVLRLLEIHDLLEAGPVLERTWIALRDEADTADGEPPDGPADSRPLDRPATIERDTEHAPAEAHWGASPVGPRVE
jgi:radical SAM-linked protein